MSPGVRGKLGSSLWLALVTAWSALTSLQAQSDPQFIGAELQTNGELVLRWTGVTGTTHQLQVSTNLTDWITLTTSRATATNQQTDTGAAYQAWRAYRILDRGVTNLLTGDHVQTDAGEVVIHPINHASLVMQWQDRMIYNDPVGAVGTYGGFPKADLVLVSHVHDDHYSASTLAGILAAEGRIVAPAAIYASLPAALKAKAIPLAYGQTTNLIGVTIEAVPAYNSYHPKGTGNGYVMTLGSRRMFFSGDTGDVAEVRALRDIDVAFVCMNIPFTMTVAQAVSTVREFQPRVVYPYHFRNQDGGRANTNQFRTQIGTDLGIEVRLRRWY